MEQNDSPYVYEKPLRPRAAKSVRALATVGLFAVGTAIGGSAVGAAMAASESTDLQSTAADQNANFSVIDPVAETTDSFGNAAAAVAIDQPESQIVQLPLQSAITLPALPDQNFSNFSSATPSSGASGSGSGGYSYGEDDDDDDRYESRANYNDEDHDDDNDDDYEDGDDD
jgi:hypothetical protein